VRLFEPNIGRKEAEVVFAITAEWIAGEHVVGAANVPALAAATPA
jgi:hypothetical protein